MIRLTREVRFALNRRAEATRDTPNGFGGVPAVQGLAHFFALRVTLGGAVDPKSSYLRNIKQIDDRVRSVGLPVLESLVRDGSFTHARALGGLHNALRDAWPGSELVRLELHLSPYQSIAILSSEPTMIRLSQKFEFSAAHRLHNPELSDDANRATFGKCNNPHGHGHNYEVEVTLAGTPDATGTLIPVPDFERIVDDHAIDALDHKFLNVEVDAFKTLNPSVENIAKVVYQMLKSPLSRDHCRLERVTVWETPKTWAEYSE
jgi:6-pyruvoyltetrahydropterin/6-carboxytetrahydropterin synthase